MCRLLPSSAPSATMPVPGRMMSIYDWAADATGTALGAGLFVFTALGKRAGAKPPTAEAASAPKSTGRSQ